MATPALCGTLADEPGVRLDLDIVHKDPTEASFIVSGSGWSAGANRLFSRRKIYASSAPTPANTQGFRGDIIIVWPKAAGQVNEYEAITTDPTGATWMAKAADGAQVV